MSQRSFSGSVEMEWSDWRERGEVSASRVTAELVKITSCMVDERNSPDFSHAGIFCQCCPTRMAEYGTDFHHAALRCYGRLLGGSPVFSDAGTAA